MMHLKDFVAAYRPMVDDALYSFLEEKAKNAPDPYNRAVTEDILRFARAGGKRLRPLLVLVGYMGAGKEVDENIVRASISIELLHNYFLIHDDVMDEDELRRGQPTVWKSLQGKFDGEKHFAYSLAICAGDIAETYAAQAVAASGLPEHVVLSMLTKLHNISELTGYGQVLDIVLESLPLEKVREEDVLTVHEYKTSRYSVEGPLHLGAIAAEADRLMEEYTRYAIPAGIAFQLKDDILGLFGEEEEIGKPVGSDVREGKRTLLVLKAYEWGTREQRERIKELLGKKDLTREELEEFREIVRETGSLEYSENMMKRLVDEAKGALERSDIAEPARSLLLELADYMVKRKK